MLCFLCSLLNYIRGILVILWAWFTGAAFLEQAAQNPPLRITANLLPRIQECQRSRPESEEEPLSASRQRRSSSRDRPLKIPTAVPQEVSQHSAGDSNLEVDDNMMNIMEAARRSVTPGGCDIEENDDDTASICSYSSHRGLRPIRERQQEEEQSE